EAPGGFDQHVLALAVASEEEAPDGEDELLLRARAQVVDVDRGVEDLGVAPPVALDPALREARVGADEVVAVEGLPGGQVMRRLLEEIAPVREETAEHQAVEGVRRARHAYAADVHTHHARIASTGRARGQVDRGARDLDLDRTAEPARERERVPGEI